MRILCGAAAIIVGLAASGWAQENEPLPKDSSNPKQAFYMSAADLAAAAAKLPARPSANTTLLERYDASSITALGYRMAIDRRMQPQNGNVHNTEAEMWFVLEGSGAVTTGGKVVPIMKEGKVAGRRIEGGTVHKVSKGDVLFFPEGVPHQATESNPSLTFLTFEVPRPRVEPR
ncbi:MAG: cupin domain-containing protein [Acidobacteria bacterium]|nr:cupin domain-containing protein [Acidobacteriota bacterium]